MTPDLETDLTAAERAAQKRFFANYVAGRRLVCSLFHLVVALGAVGGAVYGISQGVGALLHVGAH